MSTCERCAATFEPNNERQRLCNAPECRQAAKATQNHARRERRRAGKRWRAASAEAGSG